MIKTVIILFLSLSCLPCFALQLKGGVERQELLKMNTVSNLQGLGVSNAQVAVPSKNYSTTTDSAGNFEIPKKFAPPFVLTVKKKGYEPFSLTVKSYGKEPFHLVITEESAKKIAIESDTFHLGDNSYSEHSANAGDFRGRSVGTSYEKSFMVKNLGPNETLHLTIGSLIGVDTKEARRLGQSRVNDAYGSAVKVFFNSNQVANLKINGDNQRISIPKTFVRQNGKNVVKIIAGINQTQRDYVDYDDFEFTNLFLDYK
jgi:hypothetical protein